MKFYSSFLPKLPYFSQKSSFFLLIAPIFNSTDLFDLSIPPIPEFGIEYSPARCEHSDVSHACIYLDEFQTYRPPSDCWGPAEPVKKNGAGKQTPFEHSLHTLKVAISAAADTFYPQIASVINFQEAGEQNIGGSNAKIMGCRHSSGC